MRVFITGASDGLGRALALYYGQRGASVGLAARRTAALAELASAIPSSAIYPLDVRDEGALRAAAADYIGRYGSPDIVIANAGISFGTAAEAASDTSAFRDTIDTNLFGVMNTLQPFITAMRAERRGALVGIASVAGYRGLPGAGAYCASKAALISYLESLRVELYGSGLRVVTVCPGYVRTAMTAANPYPMPFLIDADAGAAKIARVVSRGASYAVIPWQMALVARALRIVPNWLFDRVLANAPRKPPRSSA